MNIFEGAKYGDKFRTRNSRVAYYCRYCEQSKKHCLMVDDPENDFIQCFENGHVFDESQLDNKIEGGKHKGKTVVEIYGWNRKDMVNFRLDIIGKWEESIDEEELKDIQNELEELYRPLIHGNEPAEIQIKRIRVAAYVAYHKAKSIPIEEITQKQ